MTLDITLLPDGTARIVCPFCGHAFIVCAVLVRVILVKSIYDAGSDCPGCRRTIMWSHAYHAQQGRQMALEV